VSPTFDAAAAFGGRATGETRSVSLAVPISDLAYYDSYGGWTIEPIEYDVIVAHHALDPDARRARFAVLAGTASTPNS
jgi:hypothetical protein